jgi:hypothetical protein
MSSPYWTRHRVEALRRELSDRDEAVIRSLATVRLATGEQLRRAHFVDVPSAERQCRRSLSRLVSRRVLVRLARQAGGRGGGSQSFTFALDVAGQRLAYIGGPANGQRWRTPWIPNRMFLGHALRVTELYVQLVEAERAGGCEVLGFHTEPMCWRYYTAPSGARATLKPDAFVRLARGTRFEDAWFVEVDCDTETRPTLARKFQAYRWHWHSGQEQRAHDSYPQVLWLVPSSARRQVLVDVASSQPGPSRDLHLVHLFQDGAGAMQGGDR